MPASPKITGAPASRASRATWKSPSTATQAKPRDSRTRATDVADAAVSEDDRMAPQAIRELLVGRPRDADARASSASPMRLPTASSGSAVRIEMTTAPIARLNESGRTAPSARPVEASTKLNSPLWPTSAPARTADDGRCPSSRARIAIGTRLAERDDQQQRQHHRPGRQDRAGVEEDPDRDEEEGAEQLAERDDLSEHAVGEVGVGQGQPGDERSERNAHPQRAGREGGADGDDRHADDEQLPRPQAGDQAEQPGQEPRPADDQQRDEPEGHGTPNDQAADALVLAAAERREGDDQHHRDEVLHDRDAERGPPVGGRLQHPLAGDLDEHDGRADRDRARR